jgi:hypothetical protein
MSCKTLDVTAAPFSTSVLLEEKVRWPSQQCCVVTNCVFEPNTHPPCNFAVCRLSYGYLLSVRGKRDPDLNLSISMAAFTEFNLLLSLLSWFFSDSLSCCFQFGSQQYDLRTISAYPLLHEYRQGGNMPSGMNVWSLVKTRWLTRSPIRGWNLTCANSEIPFSKFRKKGRWRNEFFQLSNLRFAFWDVSSFLSSFDVGFWEVWFYINAFYKGSKIRSPTWTS